MPNTPVSIQKGVSVLYKNKDVKEEQIEIIENLFKMVGETIILDDESLMDIVTAISGSGPAYVFYLIEALFVAGKKGGLEPNLAMKIAKSTVLGAGALASISGEEPETLRNNVTSPNGTTQAALDILMDSSNGLLQLISKAVSAAEKRSKELGN
jgi:pyrroline-5-carboxylate reductase